MIDELVSNKQHITHERFPDVVFHSFFIEHDVTVSINSYGVSYIQKTIRLMHDNKVIRFAAISDWKKEYHYVLSLCFIS